MQKELNISVVIPTSDRKESLLRVLRSLNQSEYNIQEVIVVDSGNDSILTSDLNFSNLNVRYFRSERSVCVQRNMGIRKAQSNWIFLCDDDLEVPPDYLKKLASHILEHPESGAVSGIVLQKFEEEWTGEYSLTSALELLSRYVFQSTIWGNIEVPQQNLFVRRIKNYYQKKGNHISKAGWPVVTDFSGDHFKTPLYGLGASVVRTEWLMKSPYDEVLDPHGIGDNYGVALGFPPEGIHIVKHAFVHHHKDAANRLPQPLIYYRRILALDYFLRTRQELRHINRIWFLWSVFGNMIIFLFARNTRMLMATAKVLVKILTSRNPYVEGKNSNARMIAPRL